MIGLELSILGISNPLLNQISYSGLPVVNPGVKVSWELCNWFNHSMVYIESINLHPIIIDSANLLKLLELHIKGLSFQAGIKSVGSRDG